MIYVDKLRKKVVNTTGNNEEVVKLYNEIRVCDLVGLLDLVGEYVVVGNGEIVGYEKEVL